MVIRWLGHASFLIISSNGTKIITDPYEPGAFGGSIGHKPIEIAPDIVTVSHHHADHGYVEGLPNHFTVISKPGTVTIKGVEFRGIAAYHDTSQGAQRGANLIVVMNVDGVRVCHLGDLGHELPPHQIEQIGHVDVLLIPIGGTFTIDASQAHRVIERINPKIAIPMHYKTNKITLPIAGLEDFVAREEAVRHAQSSEIELTKDSLPSQLEIIILSPAL